MTDANQPHLQVVDWSKLPIPEDDGGASHLPETTLPNIELKATDGNLLALSELEGTSVVFAYPMTGRPDILLPDGWDFIPGARGCTPQACTFRDLQQELQSAGADHLFGLSTQSTGYQREAAERLHLPFKLLSDEDGRFRKALNLPSMDVEGQTLLKRLTLIITNGQISKVFYPVFPPDRNAKDVLDWLIENSQ
ncbi:MAG: peroxiredoxin [Rhizobiaceae bacterium]